MPLQPTSNLPISAPQLPTCLLLFHLVLSLSNTVIPLRLHVKPGKINNNVHLVINQVKLVHGKSSRKKGEETNSKHHSIHKEARLMQNMQVTHISFHLDEPNDYVDLRKKMQNKTERLSKKKLYLNNQTLIKNIQNKSIYIKFNKFDSSIQIYTIACFTKLQIYRLLLSFIAFVKSPSETFRKFVFTYFYNLFTPKI